MTLRLSFNFGSDNRCFPHSINIVINDSPAKEPIFIENKDPEVLIEEFMKELTHRQELISEMVWKMFVQW